MGWGSGWLELEQPTIARPPLRSPAKERLTTRTNIAPLLSAADRRGDMIIRPANLPARRARSMLLSLVARRPAAGCLLIARPAHLVRLAGWLS